MRITNFFQAWWYKSACLLAQDHLVVEQQRCEKLQAELAETKTAHQRAAAEAAKQLATAQRELTQLEEEASQKLEQADAGTAGRGYK